MAKKLDEKQILGIIRSELDNSIDFSSDKSADLDKSLKYYTGAPNGREKPGKSSVTSTDVADAIEWLMPQIINALTQNNQVVDFDPVDPGDEDQAKVESAYCHQTLMKYNDGFIQIYQFVKDALLHKNGLMKVFYESEDRKSVEKYSGLFQEQLTMLVAEENIEILELNQYLDQNGAPVADVKVSRTIKKGCINVTAVPLEEFRVNANHNSINLEKARFTAHVTKKTISDLVAEGYPKSMLKDLPEYDEYVNYTRFLVDKDGLAYNAKSIDPTLKEIAISECFMMIDEDGDDIAEYRKITIAGSHTGAHKVLSSEEISHNPWVACTPIIMSHKFLGISIFDRLKEIQDQKTALLRNIFDNFYLQNNQRFKVIENQVDLKDLLISRAGGIVKVKTMDSLQPIETTPFSGEALNLMGYLDTIRAGRSGVSAEGSTAPQNIGDRIGSIGLDKLMTAKEELVNLIIRVIAETGMKPLMMKIRELARSNFDTELHYKHHDDWVKLLPSKWKDRSAVSVRVGTGTGNKSEKVAAINTIMDIQAKVMANGTQNLVDEEQVFAAINEFCELSGLVSADKYFMNPKVPAHAANRKSMRDAASQEKQIRNSYEAKLAEAQMKLSDAEMQKAMAQTGNVQLKAQVENLKRQLEEAKASAEALLKSRDLDIKERDNENRIALELTKIEATSNSEQNDNFTQNSQTIDNSEGGDND
jgi:hypothetical protein